MNALAGWWRAALNPGALLAAAAAQRHVAVAAWAEATAGPDVIVYDAGDGWRGGQGIPRFGAKKGRSTPS